MKIQISRDSHHPLKRYSGVYQQQGRMLTDADWNTLVEILKDRLTDALEDVVGGGTPRQGGLHIVTAGGVPQIASGRVYVAGVAAEVQGDESVAADSTDFAYDQQRDFPFAPPLGDAGSDYLLYVDVWERTVGFLEDFELRDAGLHGADTCARTQTMAQIKWCPVGVDPENPVENPLCGDAELTLVLRQGSTAADPCDPCADELILQERVGNYLFRVEVHDVVLDGGGQPHRITLKWSSENGAEQFEVDQLPPGFGSADWVYEFFSGAAVSERHASEKHLGHHLATGSWVPQRGQLTHGFPESPPSGFSLVRRWDGACVVERGADGSWDLATDTEGSDRGVPLSSATDNTAPGHFTPGLAVGINLDALILTLDLENKQAVAGDYWYAPVREAAPPAGGILVEAATPDGIVHHYLSLARVANGTITPIDGPDCRRHGFPPLTDLQAQDVCFDNATCAMPVARTVQEAIDHLCQERDLRHHNKHLHGWGIVCGLQVECGPPSGEEAPRRERVLIHDGYAIDCEGNDVILEAPQGLDLIELIAAYDQAHPDRPLLDANGDGSACLAVALDAGGQLAYRVDPYDSTQQDLQALLDGTLLMDIYNDCIKALVDALKAELTPETPEDSKALVGPAQRRLTSLLNLLIQLVNPAHGRYVFLSAVEHEILRQFYLRLLDLMRSKTFCAMFQGDAFPAYPFPETQQATFFGKGFHTRLRLHPSGEMVFSCGGTDNRIHIYHTQKQELFEILEMPAGEGAEVRDVAFSPDGKQLYAIAWLKQTDTVFKVADLSGTTFTWRPPTTVLCDLLLTSLAGGPQGRQDHLLATGKGKGLFILNPEKLLEEAKPRPEPVFAFNAVGHLVIDPQATQAYATASSADKPTDLYNQVVFLDLTKLPEEDNAAPSQIVVLQHPETQAAIAGEDDIAIGIGDERSPLPLYVVTNPAKADAQKHLLTFEKLTPTAILDVEDTTIRLLFHPAAKQLLLTLEDSYRLQGVDPSGAKITLNRHPLQISPIALTADAKSGQIYGLNFLSNTVSAVPLKELNTDTAFLNTLETYREAMLKAFMRLIEGLAQYFKDCACHHLLVNCPQCDPQDKLYLGIVELRGKEIYKVCNFSKRKYVHNFPTLYYWLSLVPVLPLIRSQVEKFCCAVLPNLAEKFVKSVEPSTTTYRLQGKTLRQGVRTYQRTDLNSEWRAQKKTIATSGLLLKDAASNRLDTSAWQQPGMRKSLLLGAEVKTARKDLEAAGVVVEAVEPYDPALGVRNLIELGKAPVRVAPGDKVTLYTKGDEIVYYRLAEPVAVTGVSETVKRELADLEKRKARLSDLSALDAGLARADAKRSDLMKLETLQEDLKTLASEKSAVQQELAQTREELAALKAERTHLAELGDLKTALDDLKAARETETARLAEMEKRRTVVSDALAELEDGMQALSKMRRDISLEIARERPVREVTGVTDKIDAHLRELGIRTVAELAAADAAVIARREGPLTRAQAKSLIGRAQKRLEQP